MTRPLASSDITDDTDLLNQLRTLLHQRGELPGRPTVMRTLGVGESRARHLIRRLRNEQPPDQLAPVRQLVPASSHQPASAGTSTRQPGDQGRQQEPAPTPPIESTPVAPAEPPAWHQPTGPKRNNHQPGASQPPALAPSTHQPGEQPDTAAQAEHGESPSEPDSPPQQPTQDTSAGTNIRATTHRLESPR